MQTRVLLTVDTELTSRHYRRRYEHAGKTEPALANSSVIGAELLLQYIAQ